MNVIRDINALMTRTAYNPTAKARFHRVAKKYLRELAATLSLPAGSYSITSNKAGIAVSGEVTLHGEHLHVWVEQSCVGPSERVVYYRGCHGRHDYTGMENHFADASDLVAVDPLAAKCAIVAKRAAITEVGGIQDVAA